VADNPPIRKDEVMAASKTKSASYSTPVGGLPPQTQLLSDRAVFTEAYAVIPKGTMRDIVTSNLPFWEKTRAWVLARPLSGFAETFSHYIVEVTAGGGSDTPDTDPAAQAVLFVVGGQMDLAIDGAHHLLEPGGYAYLSAGAVWSVSNKGDAPLQFHWIRKAYEPVDGIDQPEPFVTSDQAINPVPMPDTDGKWTTSHFVDPRDMRHDMHVNIVTCLLYTSDAADE